MGGYPRGVFFGVGGDDAAGFRYLGGVGRYEFRRSGVHKLRNGVYSETRKGTGVYYHGYQDIVGAISGRNGFLTFHLRVGGNLYFFLQRGLASGGDGPRFFNGDLHDFFVVAHRRNRFGPRVLWDFGYYYAIVLCLVHGHGRSWRLAVANGGGKYLSLDYYYLGVYLDLF